jgi:hypothetical protein
VTLGTLVTLKKYFIHSNSELKSPRWKQRRAWGGTGFNLGEGVCLFFLTWALLEKRDGKLNEVTRSDHHKIQSY